MPKHQARPDVFHGFSTLPPPPWPLIESHVNFSTMLCSRFLYDAFNYLNNHLNVEGLFRKTGSVGRTKMLKVSRRNDRSPLKFHIELLVVLA